MNSFCDRGYLGQFASQCEAALTVARFDRCIGEVTDGAPCYADLLYYYGIPTTNIRYYHKIVKMQYYLSRIGIKLRKESDMSM